MPWRQMIYAGPGLIAGLLLGLSAGPGALAAENPAEPVRIQEWSQARVIEMGQAIYRQDIAAWVATDALLAEVAQEQLGDLRGWIVEPDGPDQKVRFFKEAPDGFNAAWDVPVVDGKAGAVVALADNVKLSSDEQAQFAATHTARANIGSLRCSENLNTAVVRDPDGKGWLVWLLTATTENGVVPIGGHYRFLISPDGQTVLRREQLSNGCLNMSMIPPDGAVSGALLFVTQIVSDGPVETHVFLSLLNRIPIYVGARDRIYEVDGALIRDMGPMEQPRPRAR